MEMYVQSTPANPIFGRSDIVPAGGAGSRSEIFGLWVLFRRSVTVALWGWRVEDLIIPGAPIVDRLFSKGEAHLNFGCQRSLGISFFFTVVSGHPRESE